MSKASISSVLDAFCHPNRPKYTLFIELLLNIAYRVVVLLIELFFVGRAVSCTESCLIESPSLVHLSCYSLFINFVVFCLSSCKLAEVFVVVPQ